MVCAQETARNSAASGQQNRRKAPQSRFNSKQRARILDSGMGLQGATARLASRGPQRRHAPPRGFDQAPAAFAGGALASASPIASRNAFTSSGFVR